MDVEQQIEEVGWCSMGRSWKDLPLELQERVMAAVPGHDLCRLRLVCKEWNHMVTQPEFASLHAMMYPRASYYFLTAPRRPVTISLSDGEHTFITETDAWELLYMEERRVFTIPDPLINRSKVFDHGKWGIKRITLAASGGLIYVMYAGRCSSFPWQHVVGNLLTKSFHKIPAPTPVLSGNRRNVVMVVENTTQHYNIVIMVRTPSASGKVFLYDSRVGNWRHLCDVPGAWSFYCVHSCVVLEGILYIIMEDIVHHRNELYSCDLETGTRSFIDVPLPQPCWWDPERLRSWLVASSSRLFFVGYSGPEVEVSIWEILPGEKRVAEVAQLPRFLNCDGKVVPVKSTPMVVSGCSDSILILASSDGHLLRWEVLKNTWHLVPYLQPTAGPRDAALDSFFVAPFDLQMQQIVPQKLE